MMTCREMTEFLAGYLAEELDAAMREDFESHLQKCPNCRVYLEQYRAVILATRSCCGAEGRADPPPPMPEDLVRVILDATNRLD